MLRAFLALTSALIILAALAGCSGEGTPAPSPSGDSGNTITFPDESGAANWHMSLALDRSGSPVISYWDVDNGDLKVLHCGDPACSSGNVVTSPDTAGNVGSYTSLELDVSGNPVVSYWDVANGDLKVLHCGDPNCSSGNTITSPDTVGNVGSHTSLALDAGGLPVVSYFDSTNFDLKVLRCGNASCSSGNVITAPDSALYVGEYTSLVLDGRGNPVVSYYDHTNRNLKVLHCGDATCSSGNVTTTPDTTFNAHSRTSLALDRHGNPVVSYWDVANHDLKILHCGDATCSSGNVITTPDTADRVGISTSLVLDGSGNPVVSYLNYANFDLKVLHCGDAYCSSGNVITAPDTAGIVGSHTSLALDGGGNPVVSYWDVARGNLKVLHCGDAYCSGSPPDAE